MGQSDSWVSNWVSYQVVDAAHILKDAMTYNDDMLQCKDAMTYKLQVLSWNLNPELITQLWHICAQIGMNVIWELHELDIVCNLHSQEMLPFQSR